MTNQEITQKLNEIGEMLEILDENHFKISAYQRAARMIEMTSTPLEDIYKNEGIKGLKEIRGIGESIAEKIEELIKTGKIKYHQQLLKKVPEPIIKFGAIPGVGPKTAEKLYKTFKVKNIGDLKKALKSDKYQDEFKEKTRQNILQGIEIESKITGRMLISFAEPIARRVIETLKKYPEVKDSSSVGSLRRMKETIGDIDLVVALQDQKLQAPNSKLQTNFNDPNSKIQNSKKVIDKFIHEPFVDKVVDQGDTKARIIDKNNVQIDLEILPSEEYGSLLQHFTGSKDHNIALRTFAEKQGFSLSEHGIKRLRSNRKSEIRSSTGSDRPESVEGRNLKSETNSKSKIIKCQKEEDVYKNLGMDYIEPELRENQGEIEAALKHQLPSLVKLSDIKGDLQMHSNYSDGENSIEELARECKKRGYSYLAITDHSASLGITHGLDKKDINRYQQEIRRVSKKVGIHIFCGIEANIKPTGEIDVQSQILKKMDIVFAAIHSSFRQDKETTTKRLLQAIANPDIDIIAHPTGRIINRREGVEANWEEIFQACIKNNTAMEINAYPDRLDLNDSLAQTAVKMGIKIFINTDSHQLAHLDNMRYGVAQARRGWCEKKNIVNTLSLEQIIKFLKNK